MSSELIGKTCTVSASIPAGGERLGEVVVEIRGGTEAFNACSKGIEDAIPVNSRAVVVDELPGRILVVTPFD